MQKRNLYLSLLALFGILLIAVPSILGQSPEDIDATNDILDYMNDNLDDVAIYCSVSGLEETAIRHNIDEAFSLASTMKVIVLAEFARQIDLGLVNPDETVPLADVNQYWLPGSDGNAHDAWLDSLDADEETVTLQDIAYGMIAFSSNATTDYLVDVHLGYDGFNDLYDLLDLENTAMIDGTFLSLYLLLDNHETGLVDLDNFDSMDIEAERDRLQALYVTDDDWRDAQRAYNVAQQAISDDDAITMAETQVDYFAQLGTQASLSDTIRIMRSAYEGDIFSDETQARLQSILNWVMDVNPANRDVYDQLGSKGGALAGIFTSVWYIDVGDVTLELGVFYRDVPLELWIEWLETGSQQLLEIRVFAFGEGCGVFSKIDS